MKAEQNVVYPYNGMLFGQPHIKNLRSTDICNNVDEL